MGLRPDQVERWVAEHGPWLHHACGEERVARILEAGIEPTPDPRPRAQRPFLSPRRDCAYVGTADYLGDGCPIRVDLRRLDPEAIVVDEDQVALHPGDFAAAVPLPDDPPADGGVPPTLGRWVDDLDLDDPENVWRSLCHGSVAVRGGVPRAAVEPARPAAAEEG